MSRRNGLIICISGPSGAGKGTVLGLVRDMFPGMGTSISVTTRQPRGTEQEGVEYFFRTKDEFEQMIADGEILEYDTYVGNYYGTPAAYLRRLSSEGTDCMLDLTVAGSIALKKIFGRDALTIFLMPPSLEVLEERLRGRGTETEDKIRSRLSQAEAEMKRVDEFDYTVVNDDLDRAVEEVRNLILKKQEENS